MTQANKIRQYIAETEVLVLQHLGMSRPLSNALAFETGMQWADKMCVDAEAAAYLTSEPVFWGWWRMQWADRSNDFLDCIHYRDGEFVLHMLHKSEILLVTDKLEKTKVYCSYMRHVMLMCVDNTHVLELSFHHLMKRKITI